jgi:Glycosyltransferase family 87
MNEVRSAQTRGKGRVRWGRTVAMGFGLLFIAISIQAWLRNFSAANLTDYLSYWAAGKLALAGDAAAAYDVARHRAVELSVVQFKGLNPFPYPPPFLLAVTPFSLLPYMWGFAAWVMVTLAIYLTLARRAIDVPFALAHPSVLINGWIGQNGFLTAGIFAAGTSMLRERPFLAGAILGLLVIKPQLALLLPVAVIAGRLWPAIAGAVATSTALLLLSLVLFGTGAFTGFVQILPLYGDMMRQDKWPWNEFISLFAFLRYLGVGQTVALSVHTLVAIGAAVLTWIAWSRDWDEQNAVLAAATLLIPPYLLTYDALLMIIPMGFCLKQQPRPYLAALLWLLCFLPVSFYFNLYRGPNTVPIAALVVLCVVVFGRTRQRNADQSVQPSSAAVAS